jgi:hypothetical protein
MLTIIQLSGDPIFNLYQGIQIMKKAFGLFGLGFLVLACVSVAHAEPAAVIKEGSCSIPIPDGYVTSTKYQKVLTRSENNTLILACMTQIEDYESGYYVDSGFPCGIDTQPGYVYTNNTNVTISASGYATLICRYKDN